jgi:hypothetical protein
MPRQRPESSFPRLALRLADLLHLRDDWAAGSHLSDIEGEWHRVRHRWFSISCAVAIGALIMALYFYGVGGQYVDALAAPSGTDLVLQNIPRWNVTWVLSYCWLGLQLFALAAVFLYAPRRLPYIFATVSLFILIRTVFLVLTPLGPPKQNLDMTRLNPVFSYAKGVLTFNNENFFSGHTGLPYLFFLIHRTPWIKAVFMFFSIVMGACVLLARNHYAIDVLGAYFTTFAIYSLSRWMFGWLDHAPAL